MAATLGEILPAAAARHLERTALVVDGERLSFSELDFLSNRIGNGLVAIGVQPGDRVGLLGANSWEWVASYYAVAKTGAVLTPLSSILAPDALHAALADAGARVAIGAHANARPLRDLKAAGALDHVVLWGDGEAEDTTALGDWLSRFGAAFVVRQRQPSDLAVIAYASTATGRPQGAMHSHRAMVAAGVGTALMAARTAQDRIVSALPLSHLYGSSVMNAAMLAGSTLITPARVSAAAMLGAIASHRATMIDGAPATYDDMVAHAELDRYDLSSLRLGWVGGPTRPPAKSPEFTLQTGCALHEAWGMLELAGAASANPIYGINKPGTIGLPYPGNAFRIVDPDEPSRERPRGQPGELMCRGPLVMMGYYNDPTATAETLRPDGWLHTGAIAVMDDDGYVTIIDRKTRYTS
jgi:long-chain acyl-CoA synthetase